MGYDKLLFHSDSSLGYHRSFFNQVTPPRLLSPPPPTLPYADRSLFVAGAKPPVTPTIANRTPDRPIGPPFSPVRSRWGPRRHRRRRGDVAKPR